MTTTTSWVTRTTNGTTNGTTTATVSLVAAAAEPLPERWTAVLILEEVRTEDMREIAAGALTWRELPLPLMFLPDTTMGHEGATIAGSIESIERVGSEIRAEGSFDLEGEAGREMARMVRDGLMRWVSADIAATQIEFLEEGTCESIDDYFNGNCVEILRVLEGVVLGATGVPMPAFADATIEAVAACADCNDDGQRVFTTRQRFVGTIAAAGSDLAPSSPTRPSAAYFDNPSFDGPTALTVDGDHVFGHLALWNTCHVGISGACVVPPRSQSGYAYMRTGIVETAEGASVAVGQLTLGTGHADLRASLRDTRSHYDHTGTAVADVAVGEDEFGIWFAGAIRPNVTDEQRRVLAASVPSGDWRWIDGGHELVAALLVNVPGYPVPRVAAGFDDEGVQLSLVAAGAVVRVEPWEAPLRRLEAEIERLRQVVRGVVPLAADRLRERIRGDAVTSAD